MTTATIEITRSFQGRSGLFKRGEQYRGVIGTQLTHSKGWKITKFTNHQTDGSEVEWWLLTDSFKITTKES